jgi:two-component system response regulator AlgR
LEGAVRILIADDEAPARERLRRLISDLDGDYRVVAEAADGDTALALCAEKAADTVLLDIRMPGLSGLQTAGRLAELAPPPAVILVTAYEDHALAAFEHGVADYLVKPVRRERLQAALERVRIATRAQRAAVLGRPAATHRRDRLVARYRGGVQAIPVDTVIYLRADSKYVTVRHSAGQVLIDESLTALEHEFGDRFVRIHRNALVAREALVGIERTGAGAMHVRLRGCGERLPVSRRHLAEVRAVVFGDWWK